MRLKNRIKKILTMTITLIATVPIRIFAFTTKFNPSLYGVEKVETKSAIIQSEFFKYVENFFKISIIPIITLVVGLIVYFKKSKRSTLSKIIIVYVSFSIIVLLFFIIWFIVSQN